MNSNSFFYLVVSYSIFIPFVSTIEGMHGLLDFVTALKTRKGVIINIIKPQGGIDFLLGE
jgi:hypothetical protein